MQNQSLGKALLPCGRHLSIGGLHLIQLSSGVKVGLTSNRAGPALTGAQSCRSPRLLHAGEGLLASRSGVKSQASSGWERSRAWEKITALLARVLHSRQPWEWDQMAHSAPLERMFQMAGGNPLEPGHAGCSPLGVFLSTAMGNVSK